MFAKSRVQNLDNEVCDCCGCEILCQVPLINMASKVHIEVLDNTLLHGHDLNRSQDLHYFKKSVAIDWQLPFHRFGQKSIIILDSLLEEFIYDRTCRMWSYSERLEILQCQGRIRHS